MPWLTPTKDKTLAELLAEAQIHGGGSIPASLLQPPRTWQDDLKDLVKTVAPQVMQYMQHKRSDDIANQYLRQVDSPFAGGGSEAVRYQQLLQQQRDSQPDTATDDLNYLRLWQQTHPDEMGDDGLTPYQKEALRLREENIHRLEEKQSGIPEFSREIARGKLDDSGDFFNNYAEARSGPMVKLKTPKGEEMTVPYEAWQRSRGQAPEAQTNEALNSFKGAQNQSSVTQEKPDPSMIKPADAGSASFGDAAKPKEDKFIVGKKYKDAQGNVKTYMGNGQWQ